MRLTTLPASLIAASSPREQVTTFHLRPSLRIIYTRTSAHPFEQPSKMHPTSTSLSAMAEAFKILVDRQSVYASYNSQFNAEMRLYFGPKRPKLNRIRNR